MTLLTWLQWQFADGGMIPAWLCEIVDVNDVAALWDLFTGLSRAGATADYDGDAGAPHVQVVDYRTRTGHVVPVEVLVIV